MYRLRKRSAIEISHAVLSNTNPLSLHFALMAAIKRLCSVNVHAGMIGYFPLDATEPLLANNSGTDDVLKASGHDISADWRRRQIQEVIIIIIIKKRCFEGTADACNHENTHTHTHTHMFQPDRLGRKNGVQQRNTGPIHGRNSHYLENVQAPYTSI